MLRINSDLVGNLANLASRSITMLNKNLDSELGTLSADAREILAPLEAESEAIAADYEGCNYASAIRRITRLADHVNRYLDQRKPWKTIKEDAEHARETLTAAVNAVRLLTIYLKPVLPALAQRIEQILGIEPLTWSALPERLEARRIGAFERLVERVDPEKVQAMIDESKQDQAGQAQANAQAAADQASGPLATEPIAGEVSFDEFTKVDLRVARVAQAELVEGADRLLRLELDLGGQTRTVLAGIRQAYEPQALVGRLVVMAANLAPRKMKFGVSEGMVLASGPGGKDVFLLSADTGAQPGQRVH